MKAFMRFEKNINRSVDLCQLYVDLHKADSKFKKHRADVLRSAIVFAVAAMDAYFTDRYCQTLVPFLKKHGSNHRLDDRLQNAGLNVRQSLEMAVMKRPYRRVTTLMEKHLDRYTAQSTKDINRLYLDFGVEKLLGNVESGLGRKNLVRRVEILVERRHKIVHAGDLNARNTPNAIDAVKSFERIRELNTLVRGADDFLDKKLRV